MTSWQIYWLTRMDYLHGLGFFIATAGTIALFIFLMHCVGKDGDGARWWFPILLLANLFIGISMFIFIPSTEEMAAIIILPKIQQAVVSNKKLTDLPDKVLDMANSWIEKLTVKESK